MPACPVCRTDLRPFRAEGIEPSVCDYCKGFWFRAGELEKLVPAEAVRLVIADARGKPGRCRGCHEPLESDDD